MRMVKVVLNDMAFNQGTWDIGGTSSLGLVRIELVGWLVEDREISVVVAKEYQPEEKQWRHLTVIPKSSIISVTNLRSGREMKL